MAQSQTGSSWECPKLGDTPAILASCAVVFPGFLATYLLVLLGQESFSPYYFNWNLKNERRLKDGMARIIEVLRLINLFNHFPTAYFYSG